MSRSQNQMCAQLPFSRTADLLCNADYHYRLFAAVRIPADRGKAVLSNDLRGGFAQFGALFLALSLVPGLAYLAYRKPRRVFHNFVLGWIEAGYRRTLQGSLSRPGIVYAVTVGAAVLVVGLAITVSREFLPALDEGGLFLHGEMVGGISLTKASEMDAELRKTILEFPEVSTIVNHVGRNDDEPIQYTVAHEALIVLHPYDTWPYRRVEAGFIDRMKARLAKLSGFELTFSQPILDSIKDKVFEPHSQLGIKIFGDISMNCAESART